MKQVDRGQRTTGSPARSCCRADMALATVLSLFLLSGPCLSAPQVHGSERSEVVKGSQPFTMVNPFGAGEDVNSLRQSYIKGNLKEGQMSPVLDTWEQEVFFLFSLHDYDKSGKMDGLEMMKLLSDFLSHHSLGPQSADSVVSMVDSLLQTQDLNEDGMLDPSELLSPPTEPQKSKQQEAADTADEPSSDSTAAHDVDNAAAKEQEQGDSVPEQEVQGEQDGWQQELDVDKQEVQDLPEEAGEAHEEQLQERQDEEPQNQVREHVPAHQGQPEI
ncbi:cell growth regulator with EF hand domain protein 1 [Brienomyrus brachyistius]|uniref:cell growth regulator with EF hand domain protein 1 n=1 Tax=Brienomyrus brachyistius TaxID=42636 RepID=UPI0020B33612|nr:cell growth regulator with EF hand domain protein 1 [Brienomyrus brachyistius]